MQLLFHYIYIVALTVHYKIKYKRLPTICTEKSMNTKNMHIKILTTF